MSPKLKKAAIAKAPVDPGAAIIALQPQPAAVVAGYHNPNVAWHNELTMAMDKIKGFFGLEITTAEALSMDDGAWQAPIDVEVLKKRFSESKGNSIVAVGGVNILWASPLDRS